MEYIIFIHKNENSGPPGGTEEEWDHFFAVARESGFFQGGSAIAQRTTIGSGDVADITERIGGFMRFDADSLEALDRSVETPSHSRSWRHGRNLRNAQDLTRNHRNSTPKNTVAVFDVALAKGMAIELAIQRTADNHLVVVHDPTVDRTTNGSGKIAAIYDMI